MRPDQHKRKKNAIYKKAHGIVNNKPANNSEKPLKNNLEKTLKNNSEKPLKNNPKIVTQPVITSTIENSHSESSEDEEEVIAQHFSRRKIENNWEKYEKDLDERKEGDDGQDKSDDDSAYNLELSLKSKFKIEPLSWKELGNIIYVPNEKMPSSESTNEPIDLCTEAKKITNIDLKIINKEKVDKFVLSKEDEFLQSLELITYDIKPVVSSLNKPKKNLVDLEKELDNLLSL